MIGTTSLRDDLRVMIADLGVGTGGGIDDIGRVGGSSGSGRIGVGSSDGSGIRIGVSAAGANVGEVIVGCSARIAEAADAGRGNDSVVAERRRRREVAGAGVRTVDVAAVVVVDGRAWSNMLVRNRVACNLTHFGHHSRL